jgi:NitT/TauT family transport system permease protein
MTDLEPRQGPSVTAARQQGSGSTGNRNRTSYWLEFKEPISIRELFLLGLIVWIAFFGLWQLATSIGWAPPLLLPSPIAVARKLYELFAEGDFLSDVLVSIYRILASFAIASLIAVPLGILMGSFPRIEALLHPLVSAWRYLPAPSFIPLLLMWFGTDDTSKLALLFIGVVWFLITLVMDHTKAVKMELIHTALTLGADRKQILWTVVVPAVLPNIVATMRQMLAAAWTYLVIAEIMAATNGIGAMMMRAKRFIHADEIMAGIVMIGVLGLAFDFLFRVAERVLFSYQEDV